MKWHHGGMVSIDTGRQVEFAPHDTLTDVLRDHLHFWLAQLSPSDRHASRWVMSYEWLHECIKLDYGRVCLSPVRRLEDLTLLGIPVEIRDDGGVPHLEPS
jgi:hypothetical protein